jgi:hypothetical protein
MTWQQYQEKTADLFRSLGCVADIETQVSGVRATHMIDVWVRFRKFGLEVRWVIECKYWKSAVPKEKVLALRAVVEDIGADRGFLLSAAGFQSGAISASQNTNITLTDLNELRKTVENELIISALYRMEARAIELIYSLNDLFTVTEETADFITRSSPPGIDGDLLTSSLGKLYFLRDAFDKIRLNKSPYPVVIYGLRKPIGTANTLPEFMQYVSDVIDEAESILRVVT